MHLPRQPSLLHPFHQKLSLPACLVDGGMMH